MNGTFRYLSLKGEDLSSVEKKLVLSESLPAPVEPGQKAGVLEYLLNGEKIGEMDVVTAEAVTGRRSMEII